MIFIDTNYFLRFFLADLPAQHAAAKELFLQGATGKQQLTTSVIVFFELYWVFSSFYEKSKPEVIEILKKMLAFSFIELENRELLEEALSIFQASTFQLEDCYHLAYSQKQKATAFFTFDKKLAKYVRK